MDISVKTDFIREIIKAQGYENLTDFCRVNDIIHPTLLRIMSGQTVFSKTLVETAVALHCKVDDLLEINKKSR